MDTCPHGRVRGASSHRGPYHKLETPHEGDDHGLKDIHALSRRWQISRPTSARVRRSIRQRTAWEGVAKLNRVGASEAWQSFLQDRPGHGPIRHIASLNARGHLADGTLEEFTTRVLQHLLEAGPVEAVDAQTLRHAYDLVVVLNDRIGALCKDRVV